jgi:hypothetical protein
LIAAQKELGMDDSSLADKTSSHAEVLLVEKGLRDMLDGRMKMYVGVDRGMDPADQKEVGMSLLEAAHLDA